MSSASAMGYDNGLMPMVAWLVNFHNVDMSSSSAVAFVYDDGLMSLVMVGISNNNRLVMRVSFNDSHMWLLIVGLNDYNILMRLEDSSSNDNLLLNMDVQHIS